VPDTIYTQDEVDQLLVAQAASTYSQDEIDALIAGVRAQITPAPVTPAPPGKVLGSGDMTAFRGLKISGHRTYNGFGDTRKYNPTVALAQVQADLAAARKPYFSIGNGNNKAHPGGRQDWATNLSGLPVATFVPTVKVVAQALGVLILHHKPEDDPGNVANFKTWFGLMSDYYRQQVPGVRIGLCLMAWTGSPKNKDALGYAHWTPDASKFDVFCIDGYAHQTGDTATDLFAPALAYARQLKKPLMICETGQENNQDQAAYVRSVDAFVQANSDIEGWLYWNGGNGVQSQGGHNYHLTSDGLAAYSQLLTGGHYAQAKTAV
jgi:hypothetical protein